MNVLITSASRKVSLVRAFQSALAARGGGDVIAVDTNPCSPALYVANRHFLVSPSTAPSFIEEVAQLCQRERVGLVVPTRDEDVALFAENRERLEECGARVMVPTPATVRLCQDKLAFVTFCREHEFATPRTFEEDQWRGAQFPLFVKPRFGKGAKGARVVGSESELCDVMQDRNSWLVQEYVDDPEYTIDLLADFNSRVFSAVPRLRQLVVAGESYVSRTVKEPRLISEATRLAKELRLVGHNTIQCFWDGKRVKFVEVNPRFGGAAALSIAAGADTPAMILRLLEGETPPEGFGDYESDLVMLRFTEDLYLNASALTSSASHSVATPEPHDQRRGDAGLKAVLFDLDNTLYPEEEFITSGFRAVANHLASSAHLDAEILLKRMLEILYAQGRARVFNTMLAELNLDSGVWLPTLLLLYRSHHPRISLFPEAKGSLVALKSHGLLLGIVTDGAASVQKHKIAALDLERYMDVVVCTDELGYGNAKPSTVPFEVALTLLGVAPNTAAYVADDITKDFAGPNRLGIKSVEVRQTPHSGLIGVPRKPAPHDPSFRPQIRARSLTEALILLGINSTVTKPASKLDTK